MRTKAIIVDIDGTIARIDSRTPYDYWCTDTDDPNQTIIDLVNRTPRGTAVLIVTGRHLYRYATGSGKSFRPECDTQALTVSWLERHKVQYDDLFMRNVGDERDDYIIKGEIYDSFIEPFYKVLFVLDDRKRVVDMWRGKGLQCLQVAEGDF